MAYISDNRMTNVCISNYCFYKYSFGFLPGASNKLGEWLSDWVSLRDFLYASSAMEAAKETKFGTKIV